MSTEYLKTINKHRAYETFDSEDERSKRQADWDVAPQEPLVEVCRLAFADGSD